MSLIAALKGWWCIRRPFSFQKECNGRGFTLIEVMVVLAIAGVLVVGVILEMGQSFKMKKNADFIDFTSALTKACILAKDPTGNYGASFNTAYLARTTLMPERYINRTGVDSIVPPLGIGNVVVARWGPLANPNGFRIVYTGMKQDECTLLVNSLGSTSFDWIYSNGIIVKNGNTGVWNRAVACNRTAPTNNIVMYKRFQ